MERKIGEIFEYKGEWYQCVEGHHCYDCDFRHENGTCIIYANYPESKMGNCNGDYRTDNQNVVFKKLEKAGEPYVVHDHSRNENVTVQDYKLYQSQGACYTGHETLCFCPHGKMEEIVGIEIKQTKEDMEEKKLNLKPFDIQKAREGKPVFTRDGRKARIICFDRQHESNIVALITEENEEYVCAYNSDGSFYKDSTHKNDLMMLPEKKQGSPRSWKEFCERYPIQEGEAYINLESQVREFCSSYTSPRNSNCVCTSRKEAEAFLALMQLRQLRKA